MKSLVFLALVSAASCARLDHLVPSPGIARAAASKAEATNFVSINDGDGTYRFSFESPAGISSQESGFARAAGAVTSQGAFSYRTPDGRQVALTYTADEHGFHPVGDHLPTPPPIPEEILRSIEYNRQHPSDEGAYKA